jgi:hypothetical protein
MLIAVTNFPNGATVSYRITDSAGATVQAWTTTGVTELVVSTTSNISTYYVNSGAITSGVQVMIDWKTSDEAYTATQVVNTMNSYVDASVSAVKTQTDKLTFDASNSVRNRSVFSTGAVVADAGNTSQTFKTDLVSAVDNYCVGNYILFTSGTLTDQRKRITSYDQATAFVIVASAFTSAPSASDDFDIVNY